MTFVESLLVLLLIAVLLLQVSRRGLVTLATSFALPSDFPQRDTVVLAAFGVVLATLVLQGTTLGPAIRVLRLNRSDEVSGERARARGLLAESALSALEIHHGPEADHLRYGYELERHAANGSDQASAFSRRCELGLAAVAAERNRLEQLRADQLIGSGSYDALLEELDWRELTLLSDDHRRIEEN